MVFLGDDVFCYAKLFTVIHIYSFQYWKCAFLKVKILLNFLFNLWKKLGFSIFSFENFTVCSSTIVLCLPSVRELPIGFLTRKKINNEVKSEFLKKHCKTGFYRFEMKNAWKSHQYLWQKLWLFIGIV